VHAVSEEKSDDSKDNFYEELEQAFNQFTHGGSTVTNQNCIPKEIKSILKSGNVCYHSVQNL
jgi:hypothetical protein